MQFMVMRPFVNPPQVKITMSLNGQAHEYLLRLPVVATRFFEATQLEGNLFKQRWTQIPQEKQVVQIFPAKGTIAMDKIRALLSGGCRLALIKGVDNQNSQEDIVKLKALSEKYKGDCGLMFHFKQTTGRSQRVFAHNIKVNTSNDFLKECRDIFGSKNIWITD